MVAMHVILPDPNQLSSDNLDLRTSSHIHIVTTSKTDLSLRESFINLEHNIQRLKGHDPQICDPTTAPHTGYRLDLKPYASKIPLMSISIGLGIPITDTRQLNITFVQMI